MLGKYPMERAQSQLFTIGYNWQVLHRENWQLPDFSSFSFFRVQQLGPIPRDSISVATSITNNLDDL